MTLDNIMKMAKADRYTDEGKKEIQDARRYKAGEISEATGLQKQTDGSWAPPKSGKGQSKGAGSEEIGKFYTKFDVQGAYDAGRQTFPEGGYTIFKTPEGQYKVVDDPKTKQRMQDAGYEVEVDVPEGTKPPKSPAAGSEEYKKIPTSELKEKVSELKHYRDMPGNNNLNGVNEMDNEIRAMENELNSRTGQSASSEGKSDLFNALKATAPHRSDEEIQSAITAMEKEGIARNHKPLNSVSAGRMQKDLDGNFWSRPEDFEEDITSRGWDVEEMNNEYAVISNEAGSQYEVRFDDHSDGGDLTVRTFKPLMIDEDDDDDIDDAAPRTLTGDTRLRLSQVQDRVYKIGEISEKTGLMKTEHGWVKPKNGGKAAGSEKSAENKGMEEKKHTLEVGSEIKFKRTGQPITIKNIENYDGTKIVVGEYEYNGKKETNRFRLDQLEYDKDEPKKSNPIAVGNTVKFKRTGQPIKITNVEYYGNTPIIVGEYEYNGKKETNRFRMDQISTN